VASPVEALESALESWFESPLDSGPESPPRWARESSRKSWRESLRRSSRGGASGEGPRLSDVRELRTPGGSERPSSRAVRDPAGSVPGRPVEFLQEGPVPAHPGESLGEIESRLVGLCRERGLLRAVLARIAFHLVILRGWERLSFARLSDYARECLGLSARSVWSLAEVGSRLGRLPRLEEALVSGALGWTKVRLLARLPEGEDEGAWIAYARQVTAEELAKVVREVDRGSVEAGAAEGGDARSRLFAVRCSAEVRGKWHFARGAAARAAGRMLHLSEAAELIAAEVLSALPIEEEREACEEAGVSWSQEREAAEDETDKTLGVRRLSPDGGATRCDSRLCEQDAESGNSVHGEGAAASTARRAPRPPWRGGGADWIYARRLRRLPCRTRRVDTSPSPAEAATLLPWRGGHAEGRSDNTTMAPPSQGGHAPSADTTRRPHGCASRADAHSADTASCPPGPGACPDAGSATTAPPPSFPPGPVSLLEGLEEADAFELDERFQRAISLEQRLDARVGALLAGVWGRFAHRARGYASLEAYARERLGMDPTRARALVRLERTAALNEAFARAWRTGALSWVKAGLLVPLVRADPLGGFVEEWVVWAGRVTVRRLGEDVERALALAETDPLEFRRGGGLPPEAREGADREIRALVKEPEGEPAEVGPGAGVPLAEGCEEGDREIGALVKESRDNTPEVCWARFIGPSDVVQLFKAVLCTVRRRMERETGRLPTAGEALGVMLDHALSTWGALDEKVAARHKVFARDGWRCAAPGCSSMQNLHDHHIRFRSAQGSNALENRITLCAYHHLRGVHAGLLRCGGRAPGGLRWEMGIRPGVTPRLAYRSGDIRVSTTAIRTIPASRGA
jgi:hypothetical protein